MMVPVRIPRSFYEDHIDRDLPAPPVVRATSRGYFIESSHPDFNELVDDARHYAEGGTDADFSIVMAARALLRAVHAAA